MHPFRSFMPQAMAQARLGYAQGEVPVGAVLVAPDGQIIASSANHVERDQDPTAHAEMMVIRKACKMLGTKRLYGFDLWVTLEPCAMCAAAIAMAGIARLYYAASDPKSGGVEQGARVFSHPTCHHVPQIVQGERADESAQLLQAFFQSLR